MKRAKLALAAIATFAVIGGVFAFKSTRDVSAFYTTNAAGQCKVTVFLPYTTNVLDATTTIPTTITYSTTTTNAACPTIRVYSFD